MSGLSILQGILLVSSNAALVPAIAYATRWGLLPEAAILSVVLVVSSLYHMCQAEFVCVLGISLFTFQLQDHFWVYSAIIWIALYFVGLDVRIKFAVFVWVQMLVFPLLLEFIKMWWFGGLVIGIVIVVAIILLTLVVRGIPRFNVVNMIAAVVLVAVGFVLHVLGGDPIEVVVDKDTGERTVTGDQDYPVYHTLWHVFVMVSIYYILDLPRGHTLLAKSVYSFYHDCIHGKSKEEDALYFDFLSMTTTSIVVEGRAKKKQKKLVSSGKKATPPFPSPPFLKKQQRSDSESRAVITTTLPLDPRDLKSITKKLLNVSSSYLPSRGNSKKSKGRGKVVMNV